MSSMDSEAQDQKEILKNLCAKNAEYFAKDSSENGQRLYISFLAIKEGVEQIWPTVSKVRDVSPKYDFDENTPGNGFRSFVSVFDSAIKYAIELNKKIISKRDSLLFQKAFVTK